MTNQSYQVIIVDDHPIFRQGVRAILAAAEDILVVGEAADGKTAIALADSLTPDIMLIDLNLPDIDGLEVTRIIKLKQPNIAVIILSVYEDDEQLFRSIKAGAAHYSAKDISAQQLVWMVQQVGQGHYLVNEGVLASPAVAARVRSQFRQLGSEEAGERVFAPLTVREAEVLDLIASGLENKQIAVRLTISDQTVKNHITSILRKLQVNDRTQAVVYAYKHGWIVVPDDE